jgi:hypothetical protein
MQEFAHDGKALEAIDEYQRAKDDARAREERRLAQESGQRVRVPIGHGTGKTPRFNVKRPATAGKW